VRVARRPTTPAADPYCALYRAAHAVHVLGGGHGDAQGHDCAGDNRRDTAAPDPGWGGTANFSERADNTTGNLEFARAHRLRHYPPQSWTVAGLKSLIPRGPLMLSMLWNGDEYVAGRGFSGRRVMVYGIDTDDDATSLGTLLHIHDPWKPNVGRTFQQSYHSLVNETPCFTYGTFAR